MKPPRVSLYSADPQFDALVANALFGGGAIVSVARRIGDAIRIVCEGCHHEFDLAILNFTQGSRGMTLLTAIHGCRHELPIIVVAEAQPERSAELAYANGARFCFTEPLSESELVEAIRDVLPGSARSIAA